MAGARGVHYAGGMTRLAGLAFLLAVLAYAAGCTRRSLVYIADGGSECSSLSAAECQSDGRCLLREGCCGGPAQCVPQGAPATHCVRCPDCAGLDESHCKLAALCRADYCNECSCAPRFVGCVAAGAPPSPCPAFECVQPVCQCHGLDEKSCLAAGATAACTPYYCPGCNGGQGAYGGCLGPTEKAGVCPGVPCPAGCRGSSDCSVGRICVAPGASPGCGVCQPGPSCSVDGDCGSGRVCELAPCSCSGSGRSCAPACTAGGCHAGESCGGDGHCAPTPCSSTAQCPADFECVFPPGPGSPHCQRRACTVDVDCGNGGYCVDQACYGALGACSLPPA